MPQRAGKMASSSGERANKTQGIRIDSSLISTASGGEVQNELEGLGVSVFDQGTFEEGVMRQLDEEVIRRAAEQRRKFLVQNYAQVQQEKSTLQRELEALSKKIASLLSRPLCDVVLSLREMKSAQEQKRKQMSQLEVRERELARLISGKDRNNGEISGENDGVSDAMFAIPSSSTLTSEQLKLIQTGHMTPFGTSELTTPPQQDHERSHNDPGLSQDSGNAVASSSSSVPSSSGLRLCSEGFDGLFDNPSPSPRKVVRKKSRVSPEQKKTKKGKEKKRTDSVDGVGDGCEGEGVRGGEEGEWAPTREEVEAMEREMTEDNDWEDKEVEEGEESTDYTTDEELGAEHVLGRKKTKRKRRPLSSGESEDGEGEGGRLGRRKRRRRLSQSNHHLDDGDEELYRLRMRECDITDDPMTSDKVIDGRLRIPGSIWSRLYGYQRTGVHWLWELHCQQAGGVVGDEMGLGKTIEMIAFLAGLRVSRLRSHVTRELGLGPVLVVCPATVMHQWVSEFHTWWAPFRVAILHDTGTFSGGPKSALVANITECRGVLITTYAGVRIYRDHLLPCKWDYVILDEGHKIRNPDTEVTLVCKQFATPHRIILSGCPMQNNLRELWSLFDFVFPGKLGTLPVFMEQFSVPITLGGYANATQVQVQTAYRCACILRDTINPYLLRRLKADVKIQLPSKNEQVLFCKLTEYQQELYEDYVTGPDVAAMMMGRKKIFTGLTVLRKLCNHPDLVTNDYRECATNGREEGEEEGEGQDKDETAFIRSRRPQRRRRRLSTRSSEAKREGERGYREEGFGWGKRSGKMIVVEALLKMWSKQKHRVLLFSQSKMMLSILELMVVAKGYTYLRMDGDTPIKARQPLIRQFNETPSIFVFLLTTRVGGLGVNLTGADRVVIYDPDWNPSTDTQAQERAWRIGQKRQVTIYRLLTSGTIEEKIYHRQIFKQFLSNRVLKDPKQRRFFKANDLYELFSLGGVHPKGATETSAIFAGTGSEVVPKKLKKKKKRRRRSRDSVDNSRDSSSKSRDLGGGSHDRGGVGGGEESGTWIGDVQKRPRQTQVLESAQEPSSSSRPQNDESSDTVSVGLLAEIFRGAEQGKGGKEEESVSVTVSAGSVSVGGMEESRNGVTGGPSAQVEPRLTGSSGELACLNRQSQTGSLRPVQSPGSSGLEQTQSGETEERKGRERNEKKSRRHKKKKRKRSSAAGAAVVEGVEILGVEKKRLFRPEGEGEKASSSSHDDYILTKLFKKSAVHSAIQHDSIMSSGSGDYVVVENEAKKVAQSAARALRESRRRCLGGGGGGWGQLTWTGQHGSAGSGSRQQPRFGAKTQQMAAKGSDSESSKLFDGQKAGTSLLPSPQKQQQAPSSSSSTHTSSASLLSVMRSRNSHSLPQYAVKDVHKSAHDNLMQEIRDFIATRCKFDGRATTDELLGHFLSRLPNSDTATFRSMLHEICDFSRVHGEGRWFLKSQFR